MHIAWLLDLQGPSLSAFFLAGGRDGGEKVVFWGETKLSSPFSTVLATRPIWKLRYGLVEGIA